MVQNKKKRPIKVGQKNRSFKRYSDKLDFFSSLVFEAVNGL